MGAFLKGFFIPIVPVVVKVFGNKILKQSGVVNNLNNKTK